MHLYMCVCIYYRDIERHTHTHAFCPDLFLDISSFSRPSCSATQPIAVRFLDSKQFTFCLFWPWELLLNFTTVPTVPAGL